LLVRVLWCWENIMQISSSWSTCKLLHHKSHCKTGVSISFTNPRCLGVLTTAQFWGSLAELDGWDTSLGVANECSACFVKWGWRSVEKYGYPAYRVEVKDCSKVDNLCPAKFVLGIFMWALLVVLYSLMSWWNQLQQILQTGIACIQEPVIICKNKEQYNTGLHVWVLGFTVWNLLKILGYIHHSFTTSLVVNVVISRCRMVFVGYVIVRSTKHWINLCDTCEILWIHHVLYSYGFEPTFLHVICHWKCQWNSVSWYYWNGMSHFIQNSNTFHTMIILNTIFPYTFFWFVNFGKT
jgi:hypothetical protein